jgi:hypothetical protein
MTFLLLFLLRRHHYIPFHVDLLFLSDIKRQLKKNKFTVTSQTTTTTTTITTITTDTDTDTETRKKKGTAVKFLILTSSLSVFRDTDDSSSIRT